MRTFLTVLAGVMFFVASCFTILFIMMSLGLAKPGGDWSQVDPEVRAWIQALKMPDNPNISCCGEADAYEADLGETDEEGNNFAIITGTRGNILPVGTKLRVPRYKVQNTMGNPTDHVIVFASTSGVVYCFVPNGGV